MAYRVELAKNAEAELEELYLWVVERAPSQGAAWFNGLERAILSLEQLPKRCRIAPEGFDPEPGRAVAWGDRLYPLTSVR
jgi:plasmid stabilization system protein ParE